MTKSTDGRHPSDSAVETTHLVLPGDTNPHGTAFGGRIMEWMDVAAGICAARHSEGPVVTVAVDDLHFAKPIRMGDVVLVHASVNHTWHTSMEVGVRVERELAYSAAREHCLSAHFTFVAVDAEGHPRQVAKLVPQSDDERRRFDNAIQRRALRLKSRALR